MFLLPREGAGVRPVRTLEYDEFLIRQSYKAKNV